MSYQGRTYHGLINQGATCYLNSVLQVLFMTKDFRKAVQRNASDDHIDAQLASLFKNLEKHTAETVEVTEKLGIYRVCEQRDAAEHFEKILTLTSDYAAQIFRGKLRHKTTCSGCRYETDEDSDFWNLPLVLVDPCSGTYSVEDGIEEFFEESYFTGDNQMYCDNCCTKCDATAKYVMKHHPEVLMLLLKRFDFSYKYMCFVKNDCVVDVPPVLEIPENQKYELYGFVEHSGSLTGGHYTAAIKDDQGKWYRFNDSSVTKLYKQPFQRHETESTSAAYLLFYRKKRTWSQDISQGPNSEEQAVVVKRKGSDREPHDHHYRKENGDNRRKEDVNQEEDIEGNAEAVDQKRRKVEAKTENDDKKGRMKVTSMEGKTEEMRQRNDEPIKQDSCATEKKSAGFHVQDIPEGAHVQTRDREPTECEQQGGRKINVQSDNGGITRGDRNQQKEDRSVTKHQPPQSEYGHQKRSRSGDGQPKQETSAPKKHVTVLKPPADQGNKKADEHNQMRVKAPPQVESGKLAAGSNEQSNSGKSQSKEKNGSSEMLKWKSSEKDSDGPEHRTGKSTAEETSVGFRVQDTPGRAQTETRDKRPTNREVQGGMEINVQSDNKAMTRGDRNPQKEDGSVTNNQPPQSKYDHQNRSRSGDQVQLKQETSAPKKDATVHNPSRDQGHKKDEEHIQIREEPPPQGESGKQAAGNDEQSNSGKCQSKKKKGVWKWFKGKRSKKDSDGPENGTGNRMSGTRNAKTKKNRSKKTKSTCGCFPWRRNSTEQDVY